MTDRFDLAGMENVKVSVGNVSGDLRVRGWRRRQAAVDMGGATEAPVLSNGELSIPTCAGDCKLRVPEDSQIVAGTVGDDFELAGVTGSCSVGIVNGDATIRKCGAVTVESVGGDFKVRRMSGALSVGKIAGDATLRQIAGPLDVEEIAGDAYIRRLGAAGRVGSVAGDLILDTDFQAGMTYEFGVGGDLVCRVPPNASVRFSLPINVELSLDAEPASREERDGRLLITFGRGDATVKLDVNGEVRLLQWGGAGRRRRYSRWTRPGGWTDEHGGWQVSWQASEPSEPADEPVTEDERLVILRMLENKQITVEEAEKLLSALEE